LARLNSGSGQPKKGCLNKKMKTLPPLGQVKKTHLFCAVVLDQGQIYTDLTGSFPTRSSKGNNNLMICYSYDATYIRNIAMKSMLIPQVRPPRTYSISPWEMNHLPREIEQQAYNLIRITRMCVTSYSQTLINAQYLVTSNKLLVNNNK
jgi:hypothetical protein